MKTLITLTISLMIVLGPSLAVAQGETQLQPNPQGGASPGTPEEKGATGWTGGAREPQGTVGAGLHKTDEDLAADQPPHASGLDLNGPPIRFAPSKTPE